LGIKGERESELESKGESGVERDSGEESESEGIECNEGWGRKKRETTRESVQQWVRFTRFVPTIVNLKPSSPIHVSVAMPPV
jgi:hypothetical protein